MKLLRHGPLLFWLLSALVLSGVLLVARTSDGELSPVSNPVRTDLVAAVRLETAEITLAVRGDLASLDEVHAVAAAISAHADSAERASSSSMTTAWESVKDAADALAALTELDSEAAERALVQLNNATDRLSAAALGVQPLTTVP